MKLKRGVPGANRFIQVAALLYGLPWAYTRWIYLGVGTWRTWGAFEWTLEVAQVVAVVYFGVLPIFFGVSKPPAVSPPAP